MVRDYAYVLKILSDIGRHTKSVCMNLSEAHVNIHDQCVVVGTE